MRIPLRLAGHLLASATWLAACQSPTKPPAVAPLSNDAIAVAGPAVASFGKTREGREARLYTLRNAHGVQATITTYGGTVTHLRVPDRTGHLGDVVLGFDALADYERASPYFGALIGRYGNRLKQGQFTLDGKAYQLAKNNGPNALHGGLKGFDKVLWTATPGTSTAGQTLKLTYRSANGEEGYPGNLSVTVVYTLTTDDALRLDYTATTDRATPLNLTNHSYFNLSAGTVPNVLSHVLTLSADRYTVVDSTLIPTGELRSVQGTPMDFRQPHAIGERLAKVEGPAPGGYDHNWVLPGRGLRAVAMVYEPTSGRTMAVSTDQPGVQFYSGNFLDGTFRGKGGTVYNQHAGFCLETQHFPDSPNQAAFPSTILRPGQTFRSTTLYTFSVRR